MSRFRKVESHLRQLEELQSIISSMKTLAQLELRKLGGIAENQGAMVQILDQAASDYLRFFPEPQTDTDKVVWLVIGSERGFCGPFNELLIQQLLRELPDRVGAERLVLAVGRKLGGRLAEKLPGCEALAGACTGEEIPTILTQVVGAIRDRLQHNGSAALRVIFHNDERGTVVNRRLLPPEKVALSAEHAFAPLLYLEPTRFFHEFLQHYLFLGLIRLLTVSLLAENRYRVQHLGGAVHRLDERLAVLRTRARSLRQEEITEEIEMILLGSGAFDRSGEPG